MADPALVILSGLPGVGKSSVARAFARMTGAVYLRIDTIETALRQSVLKIDQAADAGYQVGYGLAADNLAHGLSVVADSVNSIALTRDAWRAAAGEARWLDVEIVCSDAAEHRRRVETRRAANPRPGIPDWAAVARRHYAPWDRDRLVLDTVSRAPEAVALELKEAVDAL